MKVNFLVIVLVFLSVSFGIYSYALIDPNLTLVNHPYWVLFRDLMVQLGYHMRESSAILYVLLLSLLFGLHIVIMSQYQTIKVLILSILIGTVLLFANPVFSHDFFNYIFDAKILTYYGQNPYITAPASFPDDPWIRFMHWTHRSYPYGPTFLPLTLIPSFLGMGIFILHFILFKALFVVAYLLSVFVLNKLDKKYALFFATHPLVLIEGLVNAHNDLIAVALGLVGVWYLLQKKRIASRVFLLFAAGIKYLSAPIVILTDTNKKINLLAFLGQIGLILYLSFTREIHPWYFLPLFVFIPNYFPFLQRLNIFFFGLLLSYYPYIRYGNWDDRLLDMKHDIMIVAAAINTAYLLYMYWPTMRRYLPIK